MGRHAEISIKEDLDYLKSRYKKEKDYRTRERLRAFILLKEGKHTRRIDVANELDVSKSTLDKWLGCYKRDGLEEAIISRQGGQKKGVISEDVHNALNEKVKDSECPFNSYEEAVDYIYINFGEQIKYTTVRTYMIRNFGTKLKKPRKSHYKKDESKVRDFKKNRGGVQSDQNRSK